MMELSVQIATLFSSYLFGIFFSLFVSINYKLLYESKKIIRILGTFAFVVITVLFYFILIQKINQGILHPYALIVIFCGILTEHYVAKILSPLIAHYKKK